MVRTVASWQEGSGFKRPWLQLPCDPEWVSDQDVGWIKTTAPPIVKRKNTTNGINYISF